MYKDFEQKTILEIERIIGHTFNNKDLLVTAFTHSSYSNENNAENNEKLEFLGDSLLNFIISEFIYDNFVDEGTLTTARAKMVSAAPLAKAIQRLGLHRFMRLGAGVSKERLSQKFHSNIFEAIAGAIYLDSGMQKCKKFIANNLKFDSQAGFVDYKTKLQEYIQSTHGSGQIVYSDEFLRDSKEFFSTVCIFGKPCGSGIGSRKKDAQQKAAHAALNALGVE